MPTRQEAAYLAALQEGQYNGAGYDGWNKYSNDLGLPVEAWCGDFVSWCFRALGIPLPSMQPGHVTGFSYTGDAWAYATAHGDTRPSYEALPFDFIIFNWQDGGLEFDHVELVLSYDKTNGVLHTIGGNSGPSNEPNDWFVGVGGVHRHEWPCPWGVGNNDMWGAIDAEALVKFMATPAPAHPPVATQGKVAPQWPGRTLVLKSPYITGADVYQWQAQMHERGWGVTIDSEYGPESRAVCVGFQQQKGLTVDGQVGKQTWTAAFTNPVTSA